MTYRLSDKQLSELVLLISVPKIVELFPEYAPTERTIYRRLERHGIIRPLKAQQEYRKNLLLSAPPNLTDRDAEILIDAKIQAMLEEFRVSVEKDAEAYQQRFQR